MCGETKSCDAKLGSKISPATPACELCNRALLPPLIDLGRALAAAELEYRRLDEDTEAATRASGQMDLLYKRETALRDLIATMAADTGGASSAGTPCVGREAPTGVAGPV